ncbi:DUF503 family protein [Nitratifractor sp.]
MILVHGVLHLELPEAHSLKGRRRVVNALKERLRRMNLSVIDLSGAYVREADLAFAYLAHDTRQAAQIRESIEGVMERHFPEYESEIEFEEF